MNQQLRAVSRLWLLFAAFLFAQSTWAQLITDDFNAATLPYALTASGGGWTETGSVGTNPIQATAPNLIHAGLTTVGGSATLTTSGEDVNRTFTAQSSGSVYASMLVNVASAQTAGDYFFHFGGASIGSTFVGRLFVKSATGGFQFGIGKSNETDGVSYAPTTYQYGTNYLVVVKYTIVPGTTNDIADLFIEPAVGQAEPVVTATKSSTANDLNTIGSIGLRQGSASNAPGLRVDYIRVGTAWTDVQVVRSTSSYSFGQSILH